MRDPKYFSVLKQIYIIETLGAGIYFSMEKKAKLLEEKEVYYKLAQNELRMRFLVEAELKSNNVNKPFLKKLVYIFFANIFFISAPLFLQRKMLNIILCRRIFSKWYKLYLNHSKVLWAELLEHENLQHEILPID